MLETKSLIGSYVDSLQLGLKFKKTLLVEKFLNIIFTNFLQLPALAMASKTCGKINLELNLASARTLDEFEKVQL